MEFAWGLLLVVKRSCQEFEIKLYWLSSFQNPMVNYSTQCFHSFPYCILIKHIWFNSYEYRWALFKIPHNSSLTVDIQLCKECTYASRGCATDDRTLLIGHNYILEGIFQVSLFGTLQSCGNEPSNLFAHFIWYNQQTWLTERKSRMHSPRPEALTNCI